MKRGVILSKFSERLYELRKDNNLTQQQLCQNLESKYGFETNKSMISKYEKNIHEPGFSFIDLASDYFGITTDYLMGRSDNKYFSDGTKYKQIPILTKYCDDIPVDSQSGSIGYECITEGDGVDLCFKVNDDSMITARIYVDDIVFIKKQNDVETVKSPLSKCLVKKRPLKGFTR